MCHCVLLIDITRTISLYMSSQMQVRDDAIAMVTMIIWLTSMSSFCSATIPVEWSSVTLVNKTIIGWHISTVDYILLVISVNISGFVLNNFSFLVGFYLMVLHSSESSGMLSYKLSCNYRPSTTWKYFDVFKIEFLQTLYVVATCLCIGSSRKEQWWECTSRFRNWKSMALNYKMIYIKS